MFLQKISSRHQDKTYDTHNAWVTNIFNPFSKGVLIPKLGKLSGIIRFIFVGTITLWVSKVLSCCLELNS